ncbi:TetR/AcrR family transcriptional regulator [Nocardia asteroides NBRC 15531]|uniref:TetR family transcriptional regulator n=1 Tax=Nocardia asteroides NBRC 15531 TaxID=1110697 RepID=U5EJW0_NOCAS|nr:TetR/AcrR family transcriptional regulator [Nocardia asteroides]TLF66891.1 TetR/AcrR family transcriptional regulator [Nocardia asteroides NBRC 15531]UGT51860.1 TetR/AcrR family transcriptional regulator [Nocardia asteroides]SFM15109.1 transcriptional regulator, TetR family [Nocardia asteroides]VEG35228.1 transcriptional regulator BetI [Nocardia asteroides]GAD86618.1 putative TetR family transcriptional regulator [Nocardia asteroides NBRC 15531]
MSVTDHSPRTADSNPAATGTHPATPERVVRRRPKNRRAQIAAEAAAAFGAHGYHGVSMEDIARRLDISSAALYRHYRSKYALFREELFRLADLTIEAVTLPEDAADRTPQQRWDHVVDAIITKTVANRSTTALVRWERRYLEDEDRRALDAKFAEAVRLLGDRVRELRPELSRDDVAVRSVAMFSVVSSIGDHHASLPTRLLTPLLASACLALREVDLPAPVRTGPPAEPDTGSAPFMHEVLLTKSVDLFHERGYQNVSVEDIATAAELATASAVYRYYRSKSDLLAAAFRRAADIVSGSIGPMVAASASPAAALSGLIDLYVEGSFEARALTYVYYAEFRNIAAEDRVTLQHIQQLVIAEWTKLLVQVRPELSEAEARILVHAGFALVVDLGRAFGDDGAAPQNRVITLQRATLFGHA